MADEEEEVDIPWELLDDDNFYTAEDNYIENPELVELRLEEGAMDHVAAAICKKVKKINPYKTLNLAKLILPYISS